jgi:peptide/nickel transport system permease protein
VTQLKGTSDGLLLDIPRSLSDRPLAVRMAILSGRFMVQEPLGAFGVVVIVIMVAAAGLAPWVSRYDPDEVFSRGNPEFNDALYELSLDSSLVKVQCAGAFKQSETGASVLLLTTALANAGAPADDIPALVMACRTSGNRTLQKEGVLLQREPPTADHWLGTDRFGHDLYARIIYGAQLSLLVGVGASLFAVVFGTILGMMSAYFSGWVDFGVQRVVDAFQAFPALVLLLLFVQVLENPNKYWITLALGLIGTAGVVRIVRSAVLSAREEVYVLAARTVGAADSRVMLRHILPNVMAPVIVIFSIAIGSYILAESGLAFLGFGDPTAVSWGKMVNEGRELGDSKPTMALFTGGAITLSVLGFNLAGDALRDVLDPRLRGRGGRAGF